MAVVQLPDRRPLPEPSPVVFLVADLYEELLELRRALGPLRLHLVKAFGPCCGEWECCCPRGCRCRCVACNCW